MRWEDYGWSGFSGEDGLEWESRTVTSIRHTSREREGSWVSKSRVERRDWLKVYSWES